MKTYIKWWIIINSLLVALLSYAIETNVLLSTNSDCQYWETEFGHAGNGYAMWPEKGEAGKIARENLSARDFAEGNWGEVTNGCQVSLRFRKQIFTNGEAIEGVVLVRNVTNRFIYYFHHPSGNWDGPVGFVVTNGSGKLDISQAVPKFWQGGMTYTLKPATQHKHLKDLAKDYSLTNGTYSIYAEICTLLFPPPTGDNLPKYIMVKSAEVPIVITNSP